MLPVRSSTDRLLHVLSPLLTEHLHGRQHATDNDIVQSVAYLLQAKDELYETGKPKLQKHAVSVMKFVEIMWKNNLFNVAMFCLLLHLAGNFGLHVTLAK